jgi:hypothetical protein
MATYRTDLGRAQEPAAASVAPLQAAAQSSANAAEASAKGAQATIKGLESMFGMYVDAAEQQYKQNIEAEKEKFTQFGARQELSQAQQATEAARSERRTLFESGDFEAGSRQDSVVQSFQTETKRLEQALEAKAIPLSTYLGNVQTLTRKWIAQFPGRADSIRNEVAQLTGIKNADDTAYQSFLKQAQDKEQAKAAAIEAEQKRIIAMQEKQADDLYQAGKYKDRVTAFRAVQSGEANEALYHVQRANQAEFVAKAMKTEADTRGFEADKTAAAYGTSAFFDASKAIISNGDRHKALITKLNSFKSPDGVWDSSKLNAAKAELIAPIAEVKATVTKSFEVNAAQLRISLAKQGTPASTIDKQVKIMYDQRDSFIKQLDSTDMFVAASVLDNLLSSNKGEITTSMQIITANASMLNAFKDTRFMSMYADNPKELEQRYPETYARIKGSLGAIQGETNKVNALLGSNVGNEINKSAGEIKETGKLPDSATPEDTKVSIEIARFEGKSALANGSRGPIDDREANSLSAMIEGGMKHRGPALEELYGKIPELNATVRNLPQGTKEKFVENVNTTLTNVLDPQGQFARQEGVFYKLRQLVEASPAPKDTEGNSAYFYQLSVTPAGRVVGTFTPNPDYMGAPLNRGVADNPTMLGGAEGRNLLEQFNRIIAVGASATEQQVKTLANAFVDSYNNPGAGAGRGFVNPPAANEPTNQFGNRPDGTAKGTGYLGVLKDSKGNSVTEYSISSEDVVVNGKEVDFPTIVPTLTKEEVNLMLTDIIPNNKRIPNSIYDKAVAHANKRIKEGKGVFADDGKPTGATSNATPWWREQK